MTKEVIIFTKKGKAARVSIDSFPVQNRDNVGINAMQLRQGDSIVAVIAIEGGDLIGD
jgi:DNA gyrase/topoisomerase IV subunit A